MEIKKSKSADLERKRGLFFQIGMIVTLGLVFVAFEWETVQTKPDDQLWVEEAVIEEEAPPVTRQEEVQPPPPPPPPVALDIINIVDNDVELVEELEIVDIEFDENMAVDFTNLEPEDSGDPLPFFVLEDKPEFPGGEKALLRFLGENVRYPVICQENGVQGMVSVAFIIDEKGVVTNVKVLRGPDPNLEREAIRVVQSMPAWKPGKQRGRPVKVSYNVPVRFVLQ